MLEQLDGEAGRVGQVAEVAHVHELGRGGHGDALLGYSVPGKIYVRYTDANFPVTTVPTRLILLTSLRDCLK